jgi:hypothetical protein
MGNLVATAVIGLVAGLICYLLGKSHHLLVMWLAGGLAIVVGWGFNIAEYTSQPPKTKTVTYCEPRIPPSPPICFDYEVPDSNAQPERKPFISGFLTSMLETMLEIPAAAVGILIAIGIAKLSGAKGPAPPLKFPEWDGDNSDDG